MLVPMRSRVTLREVAEMAGVSSRTVSRVVNGETGFGDETESRVRNAIEVLGYSPNLLARALITKRSGIIGLICPAITDPFFAELANAFQHHATQAGSTMFLASVDHNAERQTEVLAKLHAYGCDGVILFPVEGTNDSIEKFAQSGLSIVVVNHKLDVDRIGSLSVDLLGGACEAVIELAKSGRSRIGMVANVMSSHSEIPPRREHGYRLGLSRSNLPFDASLMTYEHPTIDGGRVAANELLSRCPDLDGLFAYNDLMAIGAMQAFATAGKSIPKDISLIGFNDIAMCSALVPSLSSMRIDHEALAAEGLALLRRLHEQPAGRHEEVRLRVTLSRRDST